jgi:D-inositol-3-phosphate glycosyltransferase
MIPTASSRTSATGRPGELPRRVAVFSVHTSPVEQPGTGDAGGLNVYVAQTATRMAKLGVAVEIFTRATSSHLPPTVELAPGVLVRNVVAGPLEGLNKQDLPAQLCAFAAGALRVEAGHEPGHYDVVHSHYWLSGKVGWLVSQRWGVPLVHTAHTLAKVKNAALADGDTPEPPTRVVGEERLVADADRLVANTDIEAQQLITMYGADPRAVVTIPPGVDLKQFTPGDQATARAAMGLRSDAVVFALVGRLQPLKGPDVLLRATAELLHRHAELRPRVVVLIVGGPSNGEFTRSLRDLTLRLGIADVVRFLPSQGGEALTNVYRAADVLAVPSFNESFGLVALEAQACGTPVVAAAVGGLPIAVDHEVSGILLPGHDATQWAGALASVVLQPQRRSRLAAAARRHATRFSWVNTTEALLTTYVQAKLDFAAQPSLREVTA